MRFAIVATAFFIAADAPPDAVKKELAQLEGEWSLVSGERDGQAMPEEFVKQMKRSAREGVTTVTNGGQPFLKSKYTIDPSKKPKTIDYTVLEGPNKDKTMLGIYEINGDTVKFCFATPDKPRPSDFTTSAESGRTSTVWKRDKK